MAVLVNGFVQETTTCPLQLDAHFYAAGIAIPFSLVVLFVFFGVSM